MELDELKKHLNHKMAAQPEVPVREIASILKKDPSSIVHKLRRSLQIELIISIAFATLCLYVVLSETAVPYQVFFGLFSLISIIFIIVLSILQQRIARLTSVSSIRDNLKRVIFIMQEYVNRYLQLTLLLLPISFGLGIWLSYSDPENTLRPLTLERIIYISLIMLAVGSGIFYFTRWYLGKLYGNYINQLQFMLEELEEAYQTLANQTSDITNQPSS